MKSPTNRCRSMISAAAAAIGAVVICGSAAAQDRLAKMPGYENYTRMSRQIGEAARTLQRANINTVVWLADGSGVEYALDGKYYRYLFVQRQKTEIAALSEPVTPVGGGAGRRPGRARGPERGRQVSEAESPDGKMRAIYKENNLWISAADGSGLQQITTDGNREKRIKYGTASWVYGEELDQTTAFWWSPNSRSIAFYRFDESQVKDFYLTFKTLDQQDTLDVEPYPKVGAPNPVVELYIYHLDTKQTVKVDVRSGKPFENSVPGYYVYDVRWSPDGKELLFNRSNRKQNLVELTAANPATGECRQIVREEWPASWIDNHPYVRFLKDGRRFLWMSERNGYRNLYLYSTAGQLIAPITKLDADIETVETVDEERGFVYFMAHDGDNPMKLQLHRASLQGGADVRITDPKLTHRVTIAPGGSYFVDRAEAHDVPPITQLLDARGKALATLSEADSSPLKALHVAPPEVFPYPSADGKSICYGVLYKPTNFDPGRKYPLLVSVYGGPETNSVSESYMGIGRFGGVNTLPEYGILVAEFDGRNSKGRGKRFRDAIYTNLGIAEIDDQAAGVKFLRQRSYVDGSKVGIHGTSYGGYASAMCLLRYPDVFQAACAQSSPTDWRNYDTIYTERYMGVPPETNSAYDRGSALTYAANLKGKLMLYYGTADNNVHPSNTLQLIKALQSAGKSFEVQVGPDQGHSAVNQNRMLEFFFDAFEKTSP